MKQIILILIMATLFATPLTVSAVEIASRITDREIIESLAELKAGQANLDKRFEQVDKRFEQVDKRFEQVDKRFDDINHRMDGLQNIMLSLFGAIVSLIIALFGYIIWDRRTMLKPVVDRLERLEREVVKDLDLLNEDGSRLTRLIKTLREHAKSDPKLADILRTFSLL
jgi:predicted PurR-regulated permease PerM